MEIIDDTVQTILQAVVDHLKGPHGRARSRERAVAVTEIETAMLWLEKDARVNDPASGVPSLLTPATVGPVDRTRPLDVSKNPHGFT